MKKIFLLFMIVLLAGSIFAITDSAVKQNQGADDSVTATQTAQQNQGEKSQIKNKEKTLTQEQIQKAVQVKNRLRVQ